MKKKQENGMSSWSKLNDKFCLNLGKTIENNFIFGIIL